MRLLPVSLIAAAALAVAAAPASAQDLCVNSPASCNGTAFTQGNLQAALDAAASNGTADRVVIGAGTYLQAPYSYTSAEQVDIVGAGATSTLITGGGAGLNALTVSGSPSSTVSDLGVDVTKDSAYGLLLDQATARRITVTEVTAQFTKAVVGLANGATFDHSKALGEYQPVAAIGVLIENGDGNVTDSLATGVRGIRVVGPATTRGFVSHSTLVGGIGGVASGNSSLTVSDSLVRIHPDATAGIGLSTSGVVPGDSPSVTADRVTIIGPDASGFKWFGVAAGANPGSSSVMTIRNSNIQGVGLPLNRGSSAGGTSNIIASYVNHIDPVPNPNANTAGGGTTIDDHRLNVPSGFANAAAGDYSLAAGSPLIDAGDPAFSGPVSDLAGNPRLNDGNGDCTAQQDIGAYEFQNLTPTAVAAASTGSALTGEQVGFGSVGSCDPNGDALTYSWSFDDGGSASSSTASHAFAAAGTHTAKLTVTDPAGHAASATASVAITDRQVNVQPPPPPPPPTKDTTKPVLSKLAVAKSYKRGKVVPALGAKTKAPAFAFSLSEAAKVKVTVSVRKKKGKTYVYTALKPVLSVSAKSGTNRLGFTARLSKTVGLKVGTYRVTLVATDKAGNVSKAVTGSFTVK